jgi:O-antigen/teichoic acid export membrane protein/4-amino-4-deoxy-L-arabinose transferase-like glycosyltransferase
VTGAARVPDLRTERTAAGGGVVLMLRFVATSILNYGFGVALVWLLPRAEFGAVSVLQNVLLLSGMVLGAGMPWVLARTIARDPVGWQPAFRSAVAVNLAVATVLAGALLVLQATPLHVLPDASIAVTTAVALTIMLLAVTAVLGGALHGSRRFDGLGAMQTAEIAAKAVAGLALVALVGLGAAGVALGFLAGAAVAIGFAWWGMRDRLPGWGPFAGPAVTRQALPTGAGTGSIAFLVTLDVLVLSAFGRGYGISTAALAVYQVAVILARIPFYLANALGDAAFPFMATGRTRRESHAWFVAVLRWVVLALVPLQLVLLIVPEVPLRILFPGGYADAAGLIRILTAGTVALIAADLLVKVLYARGRAATVARCAPVAVLVQLTGLMLLVPRWGTTGAALAFALGSTAGAVLLGAAYVRYHPPGRIRAGTLGAYGVAAAILVSTLVLVSWLPAPADLLGVAAGVLAYAVLATGLGLIRPAEVDRARAALGRLMLRAGRAGSRLAADRLVLVGCLLLAAVAMLWNVWGSPDSQYDEVVYTRAAQQVAATGRLTWTGQPMFVHPPLSFLAQAGWLDLVGLSTAPLGDAILGARVLAAIASIGAVLVLAAVVRRLIPLAGRRRRMLLTAGVVLLAACDPILLRYGRMAIIEPFALLGCLVTLYLSIVLWRRRTLWYVAGAGTATGLTLLTKEVTLFLLVTPAVFALLGRDWRGLLRAGGALLTGLGLWLLFPLWAVQLGLTGEFTDVKLATLQRLLGIIQITGWNRPETSFASAVLGQAGQYASSYLLLAGGACALVWLALHRVPATARWLLAWLLASYGFGAYTVLLGTLNEQFFVYLMPAAVTGTVLVADAVVARRTADRRVRRVPRGARLAAAAVVLPLVALLGFAVVAWVRFSVPRNDALLRATAFVRATVPSCEAVNASGDPDKYQHLLPGYTVTSYGVGAAAVANGVHLFFLSDKDAALRYAGSSPQLNTWIRANGIRLARFPSSTYRGLEVWRVPSNPYDPLADVRPMPGGAFAMTSPCAGFPVPGAWDKAFTGPPLTAGWNGNQVFEGAVLRAGGTLPVVAELTATDAYRAAQLPPLDQAERSLSDPAIAAAYTRDRALLGDVLGPPAAMADGQIRQPFAGAVLEHAPGSAQVRMAPVGRLALDTGVVSPPAAARRPRAAPPLSIDTGPQEPSSVAPFLRSFATAAGIAPVTLLLLLRMRRRRAADDSREEAA